ncbi:MAG: hypothetical protein HDQ88_09690 [Clostridia bacterium]|nr:hypothetical protein [Clostridia bacterium]
MKSIDLSNIIPEPEGKITLRDYFNRLPDSKQIAPRKNLIIEVSTKCGVPFSTARSWLAYEIKPRDERHLKILSEITGIPVDNLFAK